MTRRIDLNADVAEGFGAYTIGNDAALMGLVTSANVACGFHGGDPGTMQALCLMAKQAGVGVGAHPGFNDLWGFGRRRIEMKPADIETMVAYQIGALQGLARYADIAVTHVKPHGALYNMAGENEAYALAIGRAIRTVDRNLIYVALAGSAMERAAEDLGLRCAREAFIDRRYLDDGRLAPRTLPGAVLKDAEEAARQAVRLVLDGEVVSLDGKPVKVAADTLCIHGDEPSSVAVARTARAALEAAGVAVVPLATTRT